MLAPLLPRICFYKASFTPIERQIFTLLKSSKAEMIVVYMNACSNVLTSYFNYNYNMWWQGHIVALP